MLGGPGSGDWLPLRSPRPLQAAAAWPGAIWLDAVCLEAAAFLRSQWRVRRVIAGRRVIVSGTVPDDVCFVLRGTLRVQVGPATGPTVTLALLGPGDLAGESPCLDGHPAPADVVAAEFSELAVTPREAFREALDRWPRFGQAVASLLSRRLRDMQRSMYAMIALEIDQRVAQRLLDLASERGVMHGDGSITIPMRITQQDLAALVGASRERINRAVVAFKRRGWIAVDAQLHVTLLRPDLLARRVKGPVPAPVAADRRPAVTCPDRGRPATGGITPDATP